jgi:hypothetical protein
MQKPRAIFRLEKAKYFIDPRKGRNAEWRRICRLPDMGGQYPGCTPENQQKISRILKGAMPSVEGVLQKAAESQETDTQWMKDGLDDLKTFVGEALTKKAVPFGKH